MRFSGNQWKLQATLSLMPWALEDQSTATAENVTLSSWPSEIDRLLADLKLFICPIVAGEAAISPVLDERVCVGGVKRSAELSMCGERNDLWRRMIAGDRSKAWSALIDELKKSQNGSSLDQIC